MIFTLGRSWAVCACACAHVCVHVVCVCVCVRVWVLGGSWGGLGAVLGWSWGDLGSFSVALGVKNVDFSFVFKGFRDKSRFLKD